MKRGLAAACACVLLGAGATAFAHRLDEYLQATTISVEKDRIQAQVRLTAGVAVFPIVVAIVDADANGIISEAEQRNYAERVLRDLSFTADGHRLAPRLMSTKFPTIEEMREGRGEIQLELEATLPRGGPDRRLGFENHHQTAISAYLVNCLIPRDPDIHVTGQNRNYQQSSYHLDYVQAGERPSLLASATGGWLGLIAIVLFARLTFLLWRQRTKLTLPHSLR